MEETDLFNTFLAGQLKALQESVLVEHEAGTRRLRQQLAQLQDEVQKLQANAKAKGSMSLPCPLHGKTTEGSEKGEVAFERPQSVPPEFPGSLSLIGTGVKNHNVPEFPGAITFKVPQIELGRIGDCDVESVCSSAQGQAESDSADEQHQPVLVMSIPEVQIRPPSAAESTEAEGDEDSEKLRRAGQVQKAWNSEGERQRMGRVSSIESTGAFLSPLAGMTMCSNIRQSLRSSIIANTGHADDFSRANGASGIASFELLTDWETKTRAARRNSTYQLRQSRAQLFDLDEGLVLTRIGKCGGALQKIVMQPSSMTNICWEFVSLLVILYDIVIMPLDFFSPPAYKFTIAMAWLTPIFWSLDAIKSFLTGYVEPQGTVQNDLSQVAWNYLRTWFSLDLVCVSLDWVCVQWSEDDERTALISVRGIARSVRLLRVFKLLWLVPDVLGRIYDHSRSELVPVLAGGLQMVCFWLWLGHFIACLWHGICNTDGELDVRDTAREQYFWLSDQYLWSLHWSLAHFVGELISAPRNTTERAFSVLVLIFAFIFSTILVSAITTQMTKIMLLATDKAKKFSDLHRYLVDNKISASLAIRVRQNCHHALLQEKRFVPESSVELLERISEPLRAELHFEVNSGILLSHPFFFHYFDIVNPAGMRKVCHTAVKQVRVSSGDVIFSDYDTPECPRMFFFVEGRLNYHQASSQNINRGGFDFGRPSFPKSDGCVAEKGQWAGEAVLWTNWMHCGTLQASTDCVLLELQSKEFRRIICPFPTPHAYVYAQTFVETLNELDREEQTDLSSVCVETALFAAFPEFYDVLMKQQQFQAAQPARTSKGHWSKSANASGRESTFAGLPKNRSTLSAAVGLTSGLFRRQKSSTRGSLNRGSARRRSAGSVQIVAPLPTQDENDTLDEEDEDAEEV